MTAHKEALDEITDYYYYKSTVRTDCDTGLGPAVRLRVRPLIGADQLTIDKITSDEINIGAVCVHDNSKGIDITGKVKFRSAMVGIPSGHINITIILPEGKVLYRARTHHYRNGSPTKHSDTFNFSLTISLIPPKGSVLRLEHHASSQSSIRRDRHE